VKKRKVPKALKITSSDDGEASKPKDVSGLEAKAGPELATQKENEGPDNDVILQQNNPSMPNSGNDENKVCYVFYLLLFKLIFSLNLILLKP
jgi:hypothetical protein